MPMYDIIIEETVSGEFSVEAPDRESALKAARERYRAGELVLEPGELISARLCVVSDDGELGAWVEVQAA